MIPESRIDLIIEGATRRVKQDSLLRNSLFIMVTTAVNSALGFAFWLLAARSFAASTVGLAAAIMSASTIVVLLATLGVGGTLIHSLPEQNTRSDWSLTFWAGMLAALTVALIVGSVALILVPDIAQQFFVLRSATYALVFAAGTLGVSAGAILDYVYISERHAGKMLGRNAFVAMAKVLLVVASTFIAGNGVMDLLDAWMIAAIGGFILGVFLLTQRPALHELVAFRALTQTGLGLKSRLAGHQLIGMGGALLPYLVPLFVTAELSSSDNAYFYTTWMMAGIFLIISPAVSQSLFAEGAHDPHAVRIQARRALTIVSSILAPGVVIIFAAGGMILSAFGAEYERHGVGLLRIVLLAAMPDALNNVYIAVLRVQGRLAAGAALNLGMGIGTLTLSWVLLPVLGINAVGWAFLAMQLGGCAVVGFDVFRRRALALTSIRDGAFR